MTGADAVELARECLDTPFRHQGRTAGRGLDCAGVVVHVLHRLGVECDDVAGYSRTPHGGMLQQTLDRQPSLALIAKTEMQAGDVLLMRFSGEPQHLAVCAGETLIHAYEAVGKCCEHRFADVWKARVVQAYRIKGMI